MNINIVLITLWLSPTLILMPMAFVALFSDRAATTLGVRTLGDVVGMMIVSLMPVFNYEILRDIYLRRQRMPTLSLFRKFIMYITPAHMRAHKRSR